MRRHLLVLALLAGLTTLVPPARAAVYAGESLIAHAATRVRATDGEIYQLEVQMWTHTVAHAREGDGLRVRIATCNDAGCFGPWYAASVDPGAVTFTDDTARLRATFADVAFDVQWVARRQKRELDPTKPAPAAGPVNGAVVVAAHRDVRSAPAVLRFAGLTCKTAASSMANQLGVIVTADDTDQDEPDRMPRGFFPAGRRKPRCF